jgi:hypothetical protein
MNTIKDFLIKRNEDFSILCTITDYVNKTPIDISGLTGLDIQYAIKVKPEDPDYINHKDLGPATKATITILSGNAQLNYTFKNNGVNGNNVSIQYVDPNSNDQSLSVTVDETVLNKDSEKITNKNITVSLATNGVGTITTIANEIKSLIDSDTDASGLVDIIVPGTGLDVVTAVTQTYLSGGLDGGITIVDGPAGQYKPVIPQEEIFLIQDGLYAYDSKVNFNGTTGKVVLSGTKNFQTGVSK